MEQRLNVFRNVSPIGYVDLISVNPETMEVQYYDVKTGNIKEGKFKMHYWCNKLSDAQIERGIKRIVVFPDTIFVDDGKLGTWEGLAVEVIG